MLDVTCECCGRTLIGPRQIISMQGGPAGIEVAYVCWCGRPGAELVGRSAARRPRATRPPAEPVGGDAAA